MTLYLASRISHFRLGFPSTTHHPVWYLICRYMAKEKKKTTTMSVLSSIFAEENISTVKSSQVADTPNPIPIPILSQARVRFRSMPFLKTP